MDVWTVADVAPLLPSLLDLAFAALLASPSPGLRRAVPPPTKENVQRAVQTFDIPSDASWIRGTRGCRLGPDPCCQAPPPPPPPSWREPWPRSRYCRPNSSTIGQGQGDLQRPRPGGSRYIYVAHTLLLLFALVLYGVKCTSLLHNTAADSEASDVSYR